MSNTRQFLVPINYDIKKQVYQDEEVVQKRTYHMDDLMSAKGYHKTYVNALGKGLSVGSYAYANKLYLKSKFR